MVEESGQADFGDTGGSVGSNQNGFIEGFLGRISTNIAVVSAIIGVFVTIGQQLTSLSQDNIERHKTFREAVAQEEAYWERMFERLIEVTEEKDIDPDVKVQKIAIITAMSRREVPQFSEHVLGLLRNQTKPQQDARANLVAIRQSLNEALATPQAVGKEQASKTQALYFQDEEQKLIERAQTKREAMPSDVAAKEPPAHTSSGLTYQAVTLASGNPKGWDIDVFWCAGGNEIARYNAGRLVATALADQAKTADGGLVLGRIRLRALPTAMQAIKGYPSTGNEVRGEASEKAVATQIVNLLNKRSPVGAFGLESNFVLRQSNMVTSYYISVFVCSVTGQESVPTSTAS